MPVRAGATRQAPNPRPPFRAAADGAYDDPFRRRYRAVIPVVVEEGAPHQAVAVAVVALHVPAVVAEAVLAVSELVLPETLAVDDAAAADTADAAATTTADAAATAGGNNGSRGSVFYQRRPVLAAHQQRAPADGAYPVVFQPFSAVIAVFFASARLYPVYATAADPDAANANDAAAADAPGPAIAIAPAPAGAAAHGSAAPGASEALTAAVAPGTMPREARCRSRRAGRSDL